MRPICEEVPHGFGLQAHAIERVPRAQTGDGRIKTDEISRDAIAKASAIG